MRHALSCNGCLQARPVAHCAACPRKTAARAAATTATPTQSPRSVAPDVCMAPVSLKGGSVQWPQCTSYPADCCAVQAKSLTKQISGCSDLATLAALCYQHQAQLSPIHISAALTVCVKRAPCTSGSGAGQHSSMGQLGFLVHGLVQALVERLQLATGREVSTVLWCLAKLQLPVPPGVLLRLVDHYLDVAHSSSCQSTATVLYALAKLRANLQPAALDCLLYYLAKSYSAQAAGAAQRAALSPADGRWPDQQAGSGQALLRPTGPTHKALGHVDSICSQGSWALATSIWALARLQQLAVAEAWLLPLLCLLRTDSSRRSCSSTMRGASDCAGGSSGCSRRAEAALGCYCAAVTLWACAHMFGARPSAVLQHGLAPAHGLAQQHPPPPWQGPRLQRAVVQQSGLLLVDLEQHLLGGLQPQSACMLLWGVNRLGIRPSPRWCQRYYAAAEHIVHQLSPSQCAAVLCGVTWLPVRPPASLCARCLAALERQLHGLAPTQLSQLLRACARLRMRPPAGWIGALFDAFVGQHQQHAPAAVATLLHAASKLGYKPSAPAVASLLHAVEQRASQYRPHELSKLLLGCAALRLQLPGHLQHVLLQAFMDQLQGASPSDTTLVLRALATWQAHQQQQQHQLLPHPWAGGGGSSAGHDACLFDVRALLQGPHSAATSGRLRGTAVSGSSGPLSSNELSKLFSRVGVASHSLQAVELCQCLWAAAWLQPALGMSWSQALNYGLPGRVHELAAGDICLLLWSLHRVQHAVFVQQRLLRQLLLRSQELMLRGCLGPRDLSALVWGYWRVAAASGRALPPAWVAAFGSAVASQLQAFSTRQLGVTLRACVLLRVTLGQAVLDAAQLVVELRSAQLSKPELVSLMASLSMLQQQQQQQQQQRGLASASAAQTRGSIQRSHTASRLRRSSSPTGVPLISQPVTSSVAIGLCDEAVLLSQLSTTAVSG